ncbi:tyrosine-type recombinase/integrase [Nostoc sp. UHCC 0252]|uniref:tyrosine-type recombinase/integrase n=1 Tax=Nostoc sp. UHCC 0252 TaxID=3110241 RepID=UPI002B201880|nr:tyrosine-type recombinase/integrase [Nostoc sp. UHCC 0252]MEA5603726.1 tyrosine-type recombinase/integrase [Nostoc sp. UHCC 0252]
MVNNLKSVKGRAKKGQVTVRVDSGIVKACFPRNYCNKNQIKLATGILLENGWESIAEKLQQRLQIELEEGEFDDGQGNFNLGYYQEILKKYGLRSNLKLASSTVTSDDQLPPKPELSLMEIWYSYCEVIKPTLKETTYSKAFRETFTNFIKSALESTKSEDAVKIRNWLVENRNLPAVKKLISHLSKAYRLAIKSKLINYDPFDGMADEIKQLGAKGKKQDEVETESDDDVLDRSKAYSWDEVSIILESVKHTMHWYNFIKFKFLTGVRTGEAIAFMWGDVRWDNEEILIRRTYDRRTKGFYPTKTAKGNQSVIRRFPLPKDGELWNLLKSIPQGKPNEVVFKSKTGKIILGTTFYTVWAGTYGNKGIIPQLMKQGKLTKYLKPYNTRHTFITHQIFDLGRDEKIVSAWCGHGEMVSQKHYQDINDRAMQINPELPASTQLVQQSEIDMLKEQLKQQQELINKLLQDRSN